MAHSPLGNSPEAKALARILYLLYQLECEFEWAAQSDKLSPERQKKFLKYKDKFIGWVRRDLITGNQNMKVADLVREQMTNERAKDIALWLEAGFFCDNIEEMLEIFYKDQKEQSEAA